MRATYHLIVIDDFYDFVHPSHACPPAYTLHLLTFIITIVHRLLFLLSPFHSPLCSELVPGSLEVKYFLDTSFP